MTKPILNFRLRISVLTKCSFFYFLFFILPLVVCPLWGQALQKKHLSPSDYPLWSRVQLDKISSNEKWASYNINSEKGQDTLYVQNIKTGRKLFFTNAEVTLFAASNYFIYKTSSELNILNLETLKTETIFKVKKYEYHRDSDQLIILAGDDGENSILEIRPMNKKGIRFKSVTKFALNQESGMLAYTISEDAQSSLALLNLKHLKDIQWVSKSSKEEFSGLTWEKHGKALAFLKQIENQPDLTLNLYVREPNKLYELKPHANPDFPTKSAIIFDPFNPIEISKDLKRVFFSVQNKTHGSDTSKKIGVEIWNSADTLVYPQNIYFGNYEKKPKVAMWNPMENRFHFITSNELPKVMLSGDLKFAILSSPAAYEPQFEDGEMRDFYVLDLTTFKQKILLKKHLYSPFALNMSPTGKYFTYYKEKSWWIYNFESGIHKNISENINMQFSGHIEEFIPESPYGNPGWTISDKEVLLYDQTDIWAVNTVDHSFKKLTKGRELGIKFRIAPKPNLIGVKHLYDTQLQNTFDLNQDLLLKATGSDGKTGYFRWLRNVGEKVITYGDYYSDQINYGPKKKTVFYREQNFDSPPELFSTVGNSKKKSFFKSNPQHKNFFWGRSELIEFKNNEGRQLKGVLFYPADYDPAKKYPMIVNIYQMQSQELHMYENPTFENGASLNITLATAEGYFVFLPDIYLEYQSPGLSAADCAVSGVKKIIEKGIVREDKIGLMGHSFGGFESSFIMSQTNIFATGIASGAVTDLFSNYYSVNPSSGVPQSWRFRGEQYNMGGSPHDFPDLYAANSPIVNAPKISAPMLLWTGKNDTQVDSKQSYEYYLALRQLRKKSILLVYPKEGHVLVDPDHQKDITIRTLEWFNYHLKDNHSYPWIADGMK